MTDNFEHFNPSPEFKPLKNGKIKQWKKKDDIVRAICAATGSRWDVVLSMLLESCWITSDMPDSDDSVNLTLSKLGYVKSSLGRMKKGTLRPTVAEFAEDHKTETCIVKTPNYYVCVKNGKVLDALDSTAFKVFSWYSIPENDETLIKTRS